MPLTVNQIIEEVCAVVGVPIPQTSVFSNLSANRTMQEMVTLANEMARRIAFDTRDWTELRKTATFTGDAVWDSVNSVWTGGTEAFSLPADYRRMPITANVRSSINPTLPMTFVADHDQWVENRLRGYTEVRGEWMLMGGKMHIQPILKGIKPYEPGPPEVMSVPAQTVMFPYLDRNCIRVHGVTGDHTDTFRNEDDTYRLDDRLLKLGMIWQWKANKGSPYAEDMGTFSDALAMTMGKDQPAPILIGRVASSQATVAFPGNLTGPPWPFYGGG